MPIDPVAALGAYLRAQPRPLPRSHNAPAPCATGRQDRPAEPEQVPSASQGPTEED